MSLSPSLIRMSGVEGHTGRDQSCKWRRSKKLDVDEPYEPHILSLSLSLSLCLSHSRSLLSLARTDISIFKQVDGGQQDLL